MRHQALLVASAVVLAGGLSSARPVTITGSPTILDGDTFSIGPVRIRLNGIDAPEAGQVCDDGKGGTWPCGTEAMERLAELVGSVEVRCVALDRDAYGRVIADCEAIGVNLGRALVEAGMAWAFRTYSEVFASAEDSARADRVGIWAGESQAPWDYRADKWNRAAAASPRSGCPIKGNISQSGERIYHTPWSPHYERTRIDEAAGERWFCDEAEASAEGWRAARWR